MFDVPGYAQVMGGEHNGQYVKDGVLYRRASDGTMYRVDTGTPAAADTNAPEPDQRPAPTAATPEPAPEAKPPSAADRAAIADGLVNDFTAEELTAKAIALAATAKVRFSPKVGDKAARHAADFIAKHGGA